MKTRVIIQGSTYDLYPPGYDLTHSGKIISLADNEDYAERFSEALLTFNPGAANQLSSFFRTNEQLADIRQRLKTGELIVVLHDDSNKRHDRLSTRTWLEAHSDTHHTTINSTIPVQGGTISGKTLSVPPLQKKKRSSQPVENRFDHKLVIEIAGRALARQQSIQISQSQNEPSQRQFPTNDHRQPHRSLVTFNNLSSARRKVGVAIAMSGEPSPMVLPLLDNAAPGKDDISKTEWDNLIIPIKPLRYRSGDRNKNAAGLLRNGWLYVFWQGQLWRELEVKDNSALCDVRVGWYRNQIRFGIHAPDAPRAAEGRWLTNVWVPYKIDGEYQLGRNGTRMAFSEVQWSWEVIQRIEASTGALLEKTTAIDAIQHYSKQQDFEITDGDVGAVELALATSQRADARVLAAGREQRIAAVYLDAVDVTQTVVVKLVDANGDPVIDARFQLRGSESVLYEGVLDKSGQATVVIPSLDTLNISFPDFDQQLWSRSP